MPLNVPGQQGFFGQKLLYPVFSKEALTLRIHRLYRFGGLSLGYHEQGDVLRLASCTLRSGSDSLHHIGVPHASNKPKKPASA